jgi:hypothetical protein
MSQSFNGPCPTTAGLLLFILLAGPVARFVPLSTLADMLLVVCWNMAAERAESVRLLGGWRGAAVLLATFGLTLIKDLTFESFCNYWRIKRREVDRVFGFRSQEASVN